MVIFSAKKTNPKKDTARKYLVKYLCELKVHFDLNDVEIKDIIKDTYISKTFLYKLKKRAERFFRKK